MCTLLSPNIVFIRTYSSQTYSFSSLDIYVIIRCSSRHQNEDQCADAQASSHRSNKLPECQPSCVSPRNLVCTTCNPYQMMFCFFCHRKNWGVVTCAYSSLYAPIAIVAPSLGLVCNVPSPSLSCQLKLLLLPIVFRPCDTLCSLLGYGCKLLYTGSLCV